MKKSKCESKAEEKLNYSNDLKFLESYKEKIFEERKLINNAESEILDNLYLQWKVQDELISLNTPHDAIRVAKIAEDNGFDGNIFYNTVENISQSKLSQLSKQLETISQLIEHLQKEHAEQ